jgi:AcrR family transcriptional regulator
MSRTVKKPEIRRREIVEMARQLFDTQTYDGTSMQDVMGALGIAKGTIYHYFKSKDELLAAVVESAVEHSFPELEHLVAETPGNALDKLRALIGARSIVAGQGALLESLRQPANLGVHTRLLAAAFAKHAPLYGELIRHGCEQGLFTTEHPLESAEFILAAVQFLADAGAYPWTAEDLARRARALPALIEAQLKAAPGSFKFVADYLPRPG